MPALAPEQPLEGSAAAGEIVQYTISLLGGLQYRIDLQDVDGGSFDAGLRIYDAGRPHLESRGGLMQDAALGFIDSRTAGTFYFTPPVDATYEIDVALAQASGFMLTVHGPQLSQAYSRAPSQAAGVFMGSPGNDLIALGSFGQAIAFSASGGPDATISAGGGFDVLVADKIDLNWLEQIKVVHANEAVGSDAGGLYLTGQYHPVTLNSTPGLLDQTLVRVKLDSVEAVQFADRVVYTLTADQAQVARLYEGALGRAPEIGGLAFHLDALTHGASIQDIAHGFLASAEYASMARAESVDAFITSLYRNALQRDPEDQGLAFWKAALAGGASSEAVLIGISNSAEAQALWGSVIVQG